MRKWLFTLCGLMIFFLAACAKTPVPMETTQPTEETTAPETLPTGTTAPETVPEETVDETYWALPAWDGPSYEAYFAEERMLDLVGSWKVSDECRKEHSHEYEWWECNESYRAGNDEMGIFIAEDNKTSELIYRVPNTAGLVKERYVLADGRYVYVITEEDKQLLRIELITGERKLLFSEEVLTFKLFDRDLMFFAAMKESEVTIYRLYLPEDRLEALHTICLDTPASWFRFHLPKTNQDTVIIWEMMNPPFYPLLLAAVDNPDNAYMQDQRMSGIPPILPEEIDDIYNLLGNELGLERLCWVIQDAEGVRPFLRGIYNWETGEYTEKLGFIDRCFFGTGIHDDHFE